MLKDIEMVLLLQQHKKFIKIRYRIFNRITTTVDLNKTSFNTGNHGKLKMLTINKRVQEEQITSLQNYANSI